MIFGNSSAAEFCQKTNNQDVGEFSVYLTGVNSTYVVATTPFRNFSGENTNARTRSRISLQARGAIAKYLNPGKNEVDVSMHGVQVKKLNCRGEDLIAFVLKR